MKFSTRLSVCAWSVLAFAAAARAASIVVTIADNDSSVTKTLTSATGTYSITGANFILTDFQGIVGANIAGTISTDDNIPGASPTLTVSIGAMLGATPLKTLTVTVTDANFTDIFGDLYLGTSGVNGNGNFTSGMTGTNQAVFNSPPTTVTVSSTSADGLTFPSHGASQFFSASQPGGVLTIVDTLSATFLTTGDNVNLLSGAADAGLITPEPSSIVLGLTGLLALGLARRRRSQR